MFSLYFFSIVKHHYSYWNSCWYRWLFRNCSPGSTSCCQKWTWGGHFGQPKVAWGGPLLVAKSGPGGPLLTRAMFCMTGQQQSSSLHQVRTISFTCTAIGSSWYKRNAERYQHCCKAADPLLSHYTTSVVGSRLTFDSLILGTNSKAPPPPAPCNHPTHGKEEDVKN